MDGWIEHDGGPCPVEPMAEVEATSRNGWTVTTTATMLIWEKVAKYRLTKAPPKQD